MESWVALSSQKGLKPVELYVTSFVDRWCTNSARKKQKENQKKNKKLVFALCEKIEEKP
jgi:hypothetical protein